MPAYFYPNGPGLGEWNRLIASGKKAPIVAIVNPNSGPGDHVDTNYAAVVRRARDAGVTLVGYIGTQYGRKPVSQIEEEIDRFLRFYPGIQGFHLDEQASGAGDVEYYATLASFIRRRIPGGLVLTNPGTPCAERYVQDRAADAVCMFERDSGLAQFQMPPWTSRYPHSRFCLQQYHVSTATDMNDLIARVVKLGAGYTYLTDRHGPNPYSELPTYWDDEVAAVRRVNTGG